MIMMKSRTKNIQFIIFTLKDFISSLCNLKKTAVKKMRTAQFNYIKDYFSSVSIQLRKFKRNNVAFIERK